MIDPQTAQALQERYRNLYEIGRGGMATVYGAHDVKHDRTVALKVLHDDLAASLGPERFKREIRIAARLQHPHILSVFDSGESAGRLWFTMPFVSGESLRERLRREGTLAVDEALRITREAALALAHAHKQGVIHRDIKPENILLTEDGTTLVADFGIARTLDDGDAGMGVTQALTQTGSAIGTPTYMAPEQATGETVLDERVDQYALAAVLYEMLTGAPPFTGANAAALIAARFTSAVVPLRTRRSEVPIEVDAAVQRGLALKPIDRFPTISDFARAVAPAVNTPSHFETAPWPRTPAVRRRSWLVGAGMVALVAVAGAAIWRRSAAAGAPDAPIRIAVLPLQNVGDSADAFVADGIGDELRGKLLEIPGMQVIARASSRQYAGTTKLPSQIAEELGVRYLLGGTIRYEHRPDGTSLIHLRPELVEVTGDGPATTRWQASFDEPLTDVTALQARIAEQVAGQLSVTLNAAARRSLAMVPTQNPAAYEAYLRGRINTGDDVRLTRERLSDLQRAVELDPNFAEAWSQIARGWATVSVNTGPSPEMSARVLAAAERARALAPGSLADHLAWAFYYRVITRDAVKAERELLAAKRVAPNDVLVNLRLAALSEESGRTDVARLSYERVLETDPRNTTVWLLYGDLMLIEREYAKARAAFDRGLVLAPALLFAVHKRALASLAVGDLAGARAVLTEAYRRVAPEALDVYVATYFDASWVLDEAGQRRVLDAPLSAFDDDAGTRLLVFAQIHRLRGDTAASRAAAVSALKLLRESASRAPDDTQWPSLGAFAAALAGRPSEAVALIRTAQAREARVPPLRVNSAYNAELRARAYVLNGDHDRAFDEIEAILSKPGFLSRGFLSLDPMWAPLRTLPRYKRIMATVSAQEVR